MKNPFYSYGEALVGLGECLMDIDSSIDEVAGKAHKCGLKLHFIFSKKASPKSKVAGKSASNKHITKRRSTGGKNSAS